MKRINFVIQTAVILSLGCSPISSCNKNPQKINSRIQQQEEKTTTNNPLKIAYIEIDSISSQYDFCKEHEQALKKKSENMGNELNRKGAALQKAAAEFQKKASQGLYTEETGRQAQVALQNQQKNLQALQEKYSAQIQKETTKYNETLRDSIQNFLAIYNKTHKYSLILSKAGDNILMAEKSMDITNDIISGLNKRYKKGK